MTSDSDVTNIYDAAIAENDSWFVCVNDFATVSEPAIHNTIRFSGDGSNASTEARKLKKRKLRDTFVPLHDAAHFCVPLSSFDLSTPAHSSATSILADTYLIAFTEIQRSQSDLFYSALSLVTAILKEFKTTGERAAIKVVYKTLFAFRKDGRHELSDAVLENVPIDKLSPAVLISLLTITAAQKSKLENRSRFFSYCKARFEAQKGEATARELLKGLE